MHGRERGGDVYLRKGQRSIQLQLPDFLSVHWDTKFRLDDTVRPIGQEGSSQDWSRRLKQDSWL